MSYETPEQKIMLDALLVAAITCAEHQIKYGKCLAMLNQAFGREYVKDRPTLEEKQAKTKTGKAIVLLARAETISRLTGQALRDARILPQEMVDRIPADKLVGEVFTVIEIMEALK